MYICTYLRTYVLHHILIVTSMYLIFIGVECFVISCAVHVHCNNKVIIYITMVTVRLYSDFVMYKTWTSNLS